jgi:diguanylate cyclase (GGDEF)-like protein
MRLATITNWAYGATVALALTAGGTMLMASSAQERERAAVDQRYRLDRLASRVGEDAAMLSDLVRQYAISGAPADLAAYEREALRLKADEAGARRTPDVGASAEERTALGHGLAIVDALQAEQRMAIEARGRGDREAAVAVVFSPRYEAELDRAEVQFEKFEYLLDQRVSADVAAAEGLSRIWRTLSEIVLGVTAFLFLCVLYFVFRKRVLNPVVKLSDVVTRLAAQDYAAVPPQIDQIDEIGDMAQAIRVFRENGIERQRLEREKSADRDMRDLLSRMTQRMQASDTLKDLTEVVSRFTPQIARGYAGRLYLLDEARQVMAEACAWSEPRHSEAEFPALSCWALRRGLPHRPSGERLDIPCAHLGEDRSLGLDTICLPLTAQRETLGLLYLEPLADAAELTSATEVYLAMLAENIGLAIANLRLREQLREMAMADPLTGLANRRQLDTLLERELAQAEQRGRPLSCVVIDVDHFKRFNDEFGHDAGDAVLKAVGGLLKRSMRDDGLAFRGGGEEYLVLLPGVDLAHAEQRAEDIRARVKALTVGHRGLELGPVTASFGVAATPETEARQLLRAADGALLQAKRDGRDRVTLAGPKRAGRRAS